MIRDDPDFEVASNAASCTTSRSSTPFTLRSAHHQGPFYELQFNSRISPSPARSFHRRRNRRSPNATGSSVIAESENEDIADEVSKPSKFYNIRNLTKVTSTQY